MKHPFILAAAVPALVVGCSEPVTLNSEDHTAIQQLAADEINRDKQLISEIDTNLRQMDSSIVNTEFVVDDNGNKVLQVARDTGDGNVSVTNILAEKLDEVKSQEPTASTANNGSSFASDMLTGAVLGYIASSVLSGSNASIMAANNYAAQAQERRSTYSSGVAAAAQSNYIARRASVSRSSVGQSKSGSFSSSGARSGGYASGG